MMQSSLWSKIVKQHGDSLRERVSLPYADTGILSRFSGNCAVHGAARSSQCAVGTSFSRRELAANVRPWKNTYTNSN